MLGSRGFVGLIASSLIVPIAAWAQSYPYQQYPQQPQYQQQQYPPQQPAMEPAPMPQNGQPAPQQQQIIIVPPPQGQSAQPAPQQPPPQQQIIIVPAPQAQPQQPVAPQQPPPVIVPPPQPQQQVAPPPPDVPQPPPAYPGSPPPSGEPQMLPPPPAGQAAPNGDVGAVIDGHIREGPFLSGPGSLAFILHHSLMGASVGFVTQGFAGQWQFGPNTGTATAMLVGTLVGAGIGFGTSAWWQFNHWIDQPAAAFGLVNSVVGASFAMGITGAFTLDPTALSWAGAVGAEALAWATAAVGGGDLPFNKGLFMASGAGWALAYGACILGIMNGSGNAPSTTGIKGTLLLSPGFGLGLTALALLHYDPSTAQVWRADLFGGAVGAVVLLVAGAVSGFQTAVPYVLAMLSSAGAITTVSLLWAESAERPGMGESEHDKPYRNVWW